MGKQDASAAFIFYNPVVALWGWGGGWFGAAGWTVTVVVAAGAGRQLHGRRPRPDLRRPNEAHHSPPAHLQPGITR